MSKISRYPKDSLIRYVLILEAQRNTAEEILEAAQKVRNFCDYTWEEVDRLTVEIIRDIIKNA